jgi:DNA-directed RNA polymerase specialized sigma24 family protein
MAGPRQRMLVASTTDPESGHFAGASPRELAQALDNAAMLELHEWLSRMRFRLFGGLRPWDQQDAVEETFIRTLEFAYKLRNPGKIYGVCFTIGLRVRAQRVTEYIRERSSPPGVVPFVPWHPERRLIERDRRTGALLAIRTLPGFDQEILLRFFFKEQTPEQIQFEMHLTETQFRLRKNRAISRVRVRANAIMANVRISRYSGNGAALPIYFLQRDHRVVRNALPCLKKV